jgi:hypothetical protein
VTCLRDHIIRQSRATKSRSTRQSVREGVGDVSVMRSPGLDAATIALPASIDVESRADRMNAFWRALVEFQRRDVLVVAL